MTVPASGPGAPRRHGFDDPADDLYRVPGLPWRPPAPGRRRRWRRLLGWLGALTLVTALGILGVGWHEYGQLSADLRRVDALLPADPAVRQPDRQRDVEVFLLVGSDTRAGSDGRYGSVSGARADTLVVAAVPADRRTVTLVSIPRDSWVRLPACPRRSGAAAPEADGPVNAALQRGGPQCVTRTVQRLTGLEVDHYVQVDFPGFAALVDAVGGVPVTAPKAVVDPASGLRLRAGTQLLDGGQALAYVRARKGLPGGSDLARIQRQQQVLATLGDKLTGSALVTDPVALNRVLDTLARSTTLDQQTSLAELAGLARSLHGLDPGRVSFHTAPIADAHYRPPGTTARGKVRLDGAAGRRLWDALLRGTAPPPVGAGAGGGRGG